MSRVVQNAFRRLLFHYWYFRQPPWDTGNSPPELLEYIETHTAARAIDIGCGTGTNVITLARRGWQVTGIDFAPRAVSLAKRKLRNEGVQAQLQVADATRLNGISGPFELAFDLGCFHGIPAPGRARYLDQLDRVLAPGGSWLMYTFLKPETDPPGTGLTEADLQAISTRMALVSRRDGVDTTRGRASAWFLFQRNGVLS